MLKYVSELFMVHQAYTEVICCYLKEWNSLQMSVWDSVTVSLFKFNPNQPYHQNPLPNIV